MLITVDIERRGEEEKEEKEETSTDQLYKLTGFQNKGATWRFIGLLTFPSKFIPNLSELSLLLFPLLLKRKIVIGTFWGMNWMGLLNIPCTLWLILSGFILVSWIFCQQFTFKL